MISGRASKVVSILFPGPNNPNVDNTVLPFRPYSVFKVFLLLYSIKWVPWAITVIFSGEIPYSCTRTSAEVWVITMIPVEKEEIVFTLLFNSGAGLGRTVWKVIITGFSRYPRNS